MIGQFAPETVLAFRIVVIAVAPTGEVAQGEGKTEGGMLHAAGETGLKVEGKMFCLAFVEGRQLSSNVLHDYTKGEIVVVVSVMETQIKGNGRTAEVAISGVEIAHGGSSCPTLAHGVTV